MFKNIIKYYKINIAGTLTAELDSINNKYIFYKARDGTIGYSGYNLSFFFDCSEILSRKIKKLVYGYEY